MIQVVYLLTVLDNFLGKMQERLKEIQDNASPRRVGLYLAQLALAARDAPRPGPVAIDRVPPIPHGPAVPRVIRVPGVPRVPRRDLIPAVHVPGLMRGLDLNNIIPGIDRLRPRY